MNEKIIIRNWTNKTMNEIAEYLPNVLEVTKKELVSDSMGMRWLFGMQCWVQKNKTSMTLTFMTPGFQEECKREINKKAISTVKNAIDGISCDGFYIEFVPNSEDAMEDDA